MGRKSGIGVRIKVYNQKKNTLRPISISVLFWRKTVKYRKRKCYIIVFSSSNSCG